MREIIEKALKVMESEFTKGEVKLNNASLVKDYCRLQIGAEKEEVFGVLFLNSQLEMLSFDKLFRGSISEATVHPRAIARRVFELNAAYMILTHNHPSGLAEPSSADISLTKTLKKLFDQLDCKVLDHIIVSATDSYSMASNGDMGF